MTNSLLEIKSPIPVPVLHIILFGESELIPQAHAHHIRDTAGHGGHPGETLHPQLWVDTITMEAGLTQVTA